MKKLIHNAIHRNEKSHECLISEINGKKVKITYEAYNAVERCNTEVFDGYKWNLILTMLDMGKEPHNSAYSIYNPEQRQTRATLLINGAARTCKTIL